MVKYLIVTLAIVFAFVVTRTAEAAEGEVEKKPAAKAAAPKGEKQNQLSKDERKAGWKLLFDGKTTKGWRGYGKKEFPAGWKVVDGAITLVDKGGGDIMTVDQYDNFEFSIDWRIAEGGNSGIMYRVAEKTGAAPYVTGPECQILDDERHPDGKKGKDGNRLAGALYDLYGPSKKVSKPAGEWNTAKVVLDGNKVEHWLNGEKIVEAEIGSADWNARIAASKWKDAAEFGKVAKGHIDLQDHGDKVEFRNIKIRPITAGKAVAKEKTGGY